MVKNQPITNPQQSNNYEDKVIKEEQTPEKIEVNKDKLDEILARNDEQSKRLEEQQKMIDMLLATADKSRISRYQQQQGIPTNHIIRVRTYKNKPVVGWHMVEDTMFQDGNGIWHEKQIVEIVTNDGEKAQLPYLESEKLPKIEGERIGVSTKTTEEGIQHTIFTLKLKDGSELNIDQTYVN